MVPLSFLGRFEIKKQLTIISSAGLLLKVTSFCFEEILKNRSARKQQLFAIRKIRLRVFLYTKQHPTVFSMCRENSVHFFMIRESSVIFMFRESYFFIYILKAVFLLSIKAVLFETCQRLSASITSEMHGRKHSDLVKLILQYLYINFFSDTVQRKRTNLLKTIFQDKSEIDSQICTYNCVLYGM
jgi:hypothetical protein